MTMKKLRIASDLDDVIFDWRGSHERRFHCCIDEMRSEEVTKQVEMTREDGKFWSNLPLLERPNFEPVVYCTKRTNRKIYTINSLRKYNLPVRPIIQLYNQSDNKGLVLKGVADVLVDDSFFNVQQCLEAGFPALLVTRPFNKHIVTKYRVDSLDYKEIEAKYYELF